VTSIQGESVSYMIFDPPSELSFDYVQVPACGYPMTYSTTAALPSAAVTLDGVAKKFTFESAV